jgi:hypothetical protein
MPAMPALNVKLQFITGAALADADDVLKLVIRGTNQQPVVAAFRILTGIEVDILEDGSLDQEPELPVSATRPPPAN